MRAFSAVRALHCTMGWLRELMAHAEPPLGSYGELARTCLAHPQWPGSVQPKPRSLASLFSKFDRGIELEWLADRQAVQGVLAEILGCSPAAVRGPIAERLRLAEVHQQRWRLPDAPFARLVDLKEDPLPPGIPLRVPVPAGWGQLWWQVEPGDGVELVRRWLAARGLARTRVARTWSDVAADWSCPEALFVEFQGHDPIPPFELQWRTAPTCIAAAGPQPALEHFEPLRSPALQSYLGELLEWIEPLFPQDGHFAASTALGWMRGPVAAQLVDSLQSALGLAGVLDELGLEQVQRQRIEQVAQQWLKRRLAAVETRDGDWLTEQGWSVLLGLVQRALTDDELALDVARTQKEWQRLVPTEFQRSVDAEWARTSLARAGTPLTKQQWQQALSHIPPGAFRIVHGLQAAGILHPVDGERLQLTPRWLLTTLQQQAIRRLLASAASEWGEAQLRRAAPAAVRAELRAQIISGRCEQVEELLELNADDAPSFVVAVEAAVEALGNAWLCGAEVDDELASGLLALARNGLLFLGDDAGSDDAGSDPASPRSPVPRLLCSVRDASQYGAWLLAWWALGAGLDDEHAFELPWRGPPRATSSGGDLVASAAELDAVSAYLSTLDAHDPRVARSYTLLTRCLDQRSAPEHPLLAPRRILMAPGDWEAWFDLHRAPHGLTALTRLAEDFRDCARRAWRAWRDRGFPAGGAACFRDAPALWEALPADVLGAMLESRQSLVWDEPERYLQPNHYQLLLELQPLPHEWIVRLSLSHLPAELVSGWTLLLAHAGHHAGLERLWREHQPLMLMETLMVLDTDERKLAESLLESAPVAAARPLLSAIAERLQRTGVSHPLAAVWRRWLHEQVTQRRPEWQEAYQLLAEIERRLKRVRTARGRKPN